MTHGTLDRAVTVALVDFSYFSICEDMFFLNSNYSVCSQWTSLLPTEDRLQIVEWINGQWRIKKVRRKGNLKGVFCDICDSVAFGRVATVCWGV